MDSEETWKFHTEHCNYQSQNVQSMILNDIWWWGSSSCSSKKCVVAYLLLPGQLWPGLVLFTNPSARAGYDTRSIFLKAKFNRFEFRVFHLSRLVASPRLKNLVRPTILPIAGGRIRGVHTFPKGIWPKVNVIARLEYETAYYDSAVHRFNHYTTMTPPVLVVPVMVPYMG